MDSREHIIQRGIQASRLLADEDFKSFLDELQEDFKSAIMNTQPHESKKRDELYYRHMAVGDVLAHIQTYRDYADQLINELDQVQDND